MAPSATRAALLGILGGIGVALAVVACNGRPTSNWLSSPQFSVGPWDVFHDPSLDVTQINYVRDSVARHIALSESTLARPPGYLAPRWSAVVPYTRPKIYLYSERVKLLNSPIRIGVLAYADHRRVEVHAVVGYKFTTPGLARAVHQLREGPDPWEQDAALGWSVLIPNQVALVDLLERSRP